MRAEYYLFPSSFEIENLIFLMFLFRRGDIGISEAALILANKRPTENPSGFRIYLYVLCL